MPTADLLPERERQQRSHQQQCPSLAYLRMEQGRLREALVTDPGSVFLANRAKDIYGVWGIAKHEIELGRP